MKQYKKKGSNSKHNNVKAPGLQPRPYALQLNFISKKGGTKFPREHFIHRHNHARFFLVALLTDYNALRQIMWFCEHGESKNGEREKKEKVGDDEEVPLKLGLNVVCNLSLLLHSFSILIMIMEGRNSYHPTFIQPTLLLAQNKTLSLQPTYYSSLKYQLYHTNYDSRPFRIMVFLCPSQAVVHKHGGRWWVTLI